MDFTEVKTYIDEHKDDADVITLLKGSNPLEGLNADTVHSFVESNPVLKSYRDAHATKAMTSFEDKFKAEKLPALIQAKHDELHPPETELEKRYRETDAKLEAEIQKRKQAELKNLAITAAGDIGLPSKLVPFFVGGDEDKTNSNVTLFKEELDKIVNAKVEERLKENSRSPHNVDLTGDGGKNPFKADSFNMTDQIMLKKNNPELYNKYRKAAGF